MLSLYSQGVAIDPVSLAEHLRSNGIAALGEKDSISSLLEWAGNVSTSENIGHHISIVRGLSSLRKLAMVAAELSDGVYAHVPPEELLERTSESLSAISMRRSGTLTSISDVMPLTLDAIEQRRNNPSSTKGLLSGIVMLDDLTTGAKPGQLWVIAGDTGSGKTSLASQYVWNSALHQSASWLIVNMEMTRFELAERGLAFNAEKDGHYLRTGAVSSDTMKELHATGNVMAKLPVYLEDSVFDVNDVISRARTWRAKHQSGRAGIVVDYLQLCSSSGFLKRNEEVGAVARKMKRLAKELEVPVLLISQLNREGKKADRPPAKHDLRDSGSIEDDADVIILGHCTDPTGSVDNGDPRNVNLIVDKQRAGATGFVRTQFIAKWFKFIDANPGSSQDF